MGNGLIFPYLLYIRSGDALGESRPENGSSGSSIKLMISAGKSTLRDEMRQRVLLRQDEAGVVMVPRNSR